MESLREVVRGYQLNIEFGNNVYTSSVDLAAKEFERTNGCFPTIEEHINYSAHAAAVVFVRDFLRQEHCF